MRLLLLARQTRFKTRRINKHISLICFAGVRRAFDKRPVDSLPLENRGKLGEVSVIEKRVVQETGQRIFVHIGFNEHPMGFLRFAHEVQAEPMDTQIRSFDGHSLVKMLLGRCLIPFRAGLAKQNQLDVFGREFRASQYVSKCCRLLGMSGPQQDTMGLIE